MKTAQNIVKHGRLKNFLNEKKRYFIGIDVETVNNQLFLMGYHNGENYRYTENDFLETFKNILIESVQTNKHLATWTRYDNTHLIKMLMQGLNESEKKHVIDMIGKRSGSFNKKRGVYNEPPLLSLNHGSFIIYLENVIRDCLLFRILDKNGKSKTVWSYNIKNLYNQNLEKVANDNGFTYYSKISKDAHVINKDKYAKDIDYKKQVLESNSLDCRVVKDIGEKVQDEFYEIMGAYPNNLISAGSLARSSVIAFSHKLGLSTSNINIYSILNQHDQRHMKAMDYSMRAYHGGKIDSYVLGFTKNANMIDLTSAYPSIMRELKGFNKHQTIFKQGKPLHANYNYMFVRCDLNIKTDKYSTPFIIPNPLNNNSNLNPYGIIKDIVLTKYEYEFVLKNLDWIDITYIDYFYSVSDNEYSIFRIIIDELFELRMKYKDLGKVSLEQLVKTILNSLYGITYELTETYNELLDMIGYRSGDFFNPFIASHITGGTRTKIAEMNNEIIKRGGDILLNMTDSIMYENADVSELCSEIKRLGTFEKPETIKDIIILGSGRYEYKKNMKYFYKTRGFSASIGNGSYYEPILKKGGKIKVGGFVTPFKSTTNDFKSEDIGLIYESEYSLNPFNLGGKRMVENTKIDLTKERTNTKQIYLNDDIWLNRL